MSRGPAEPATANTLRLQVGGTLTPGRDIYIVRPEDTLLFQLLHSGEYVNILSSRQVGKSSLMLRTALRLRDDLGHRFAVVDLTTLGTPDHAAAYFRGLVGEIARQLKLPLDTDAFRREDRDFGTYTQQFIRFFRETMAGCIDGPVTIFLDEIDSTLKLPFTDDVFTALRSMYNERCLVPQFKRLAFSLVGVATPDELIKDRRTTPYNVGKTLWLGDFDPARDDIGPLAAELSDDLALGRKLLRRVLRWTGGHPFLTTRLCQDLRGEGVTVPEAVDRYVADHYATLDRLGEDVHIQQVLRFVRERLSDGPVSFDLYERILKGWQERDQPSLAHTELKLSGLVMRDSEGWLVPRNRIYRRIFDRHWVRQTRSTGDIPELARYRTIALAAHETLPIAGFKTKARVSIRLDELYVPLRAMLDTRLTGDCRFADAREAEERLQAHGAPEVPLAEAFRSAAERKRQGLVILGDPGSGKTTQLKRLLLACLRDGPDSLGLPVDMIPVFLPLRDLEDMDRGVDEFIERSLDNPHLGIPAGFGRRLLERGRLLLLFDGLDEVSDPEQRARVSRWIEALARQRPTSIPVVTCRFAGYVDDARMAGESFLEMHVRPLTPDESNSFIRNWYRAVKTSQSPGPAAQAEADSEAESLIRRLRDSDDRSTRMAEMTRNPLLLANLCLVHYDRKGTLPKGRHELYDECIDVLLELWRRDHKGLGTRVSARIGKDVLGPVALWLHAEENRTRASLAELQPVLEPALAEAGWTGGAANFLRAVRDESGLLTGWSGDRYGFIHLGFQEYLAAREIRRRIHREAVAGAAPASLAELTGHYGASWWQEVILLLLAEDHPAPLFEPFIRAALDHHGFDIDCELTRFILEEAKGVTAAPFREYLVDPARTGEWRLATKRAVLRITQPLLDEDAFNALLVELPRGIIGRTDPQTTGQGLSESSTIRRSTHGEVELLAIPHGRYLMGSRPGTGYDRECPQHYVEILPFLLGRYPVTNAEYRRFLEANPDAPEPAYWADKRFNQARQPVVGVAWENARGFCAWAGGRLPTEAEWEYAYRAGTLTEYPWGDDSKRAAEFAWFGENVSSGSTHPVGEKPPNPWGLFDLSGNVWEWTEDAWHENYEGAPVDGSAWIKGKNYWRVIRGGSWFLEPGHLRSAYRGGTTPDNRGYDLGFRLAQDIP